VAVGLRRWESVKTRGAVCCDGWHRSHRGPVNESNIHAAADEKSVVERRRSNVDLGAIGHDHKNAYRSVDGDQQPEVIGGTRECGRPQARREADVHRERGEKGIHGATWGCEICNGKLVAVQSWKRRQSPSLDDDLMERFKGWCHRWEVTIRPTRVCDRFHCTNQMTEVPVPVKYHRDHAG